MAILHLLQDWIKVYKFMMFTINKYMLKERVLLKEEAS